MKSAKYAAACLLLATGLWALTLGDGLPPQGFQSGSAAEAAVRGEYVAGPTADSLRARRVLGSQEPGTDPSGHISPDGRFLSYPLWETGGLAVRDLRTGERHALVEGDGWGEGARVAYFSRFSPDGTRLAYQWTDLDSHWAIRAVDVESRADQEVFAAPEAVRYLDLGSWSPDGEAIAVVLHMEDLSYRIGLVDVSESSVSILRSFDWRGPGAPVFSPDGKWLAYAVGPEADRDGGAEIRLLARDGSRERTLVQEDGPLTVAGWLPDGGPLFYLAGEANGTLRLMALDVDDGRASGEPQILRSDLWQAGPFGLSRDAFFYVKRTEVPRAHTAGLDPEIGQLVTPLVPVIPEPSQEWTIYMTWAPDGDRIAFFSMPMWGPLPPARLMVRSLATGAERTVDVRLRDVRLLEWSPGEDRLAVLGAGDRGRWGVHLLDLQEETLERVPVEADGLLGWSRDGQRLYVTRAVGYGDPEDTRPIEVLAVDPETGEAATVHRDREPGAPPLSLRAFAVSPDDRVLAVARGAPDSGPTWIDLVPLDGGEPRELLRVEPPEAMLSRGELAWTPDGRHLLFGVALAAGPDGEGTRKALRLVDCEGSEVHELASFPGNRTWIFPRVRPDGRAVSAAVGGNAFEIWALEGLPDAAVAEENRDAFDGP